ncbi:cytochrome c551 [Sutcliffiella deserti]|uniref:cytochrome c551 n=1 Tax=Sutcliffiella deserti TaxID=2875501 RepID=UPI001CBDB161|nr:cytochrome c [Sutcliffiella deserti]
MKKALMAFVFGTSIFALAACGGGEENNTATGTQEESEAGAVDTGAAEGIYKQSCASCHGGNLEGGFGPNLEQVGNKYNKDEIENIIVNGQGQMPGVLKGDDATTVAVWLADHK